MNRSFHRFFLKSNQLVQAKTKILVCAYTNFESNASWCIFVGYNLQKFRYFDSTTKFVSLHALFVKASS